MSACLIVLEWIKKGRKNEIDGIADSLCFWKIIFLEHSIVNIQNLINFLKSWLFFK